MIFKKEIQKTGDIYFRHATTNCMVIEKSIEVVDFGETDIDVDFYAHTFIRVAAYIRKLGGDLDQAKDVFHDALIIYSQRGEKEVLDPSSYVLGICRHLWFRQREKDRLTDDVATHVSTLFEAQKETLMDSRLLQLLEKSGRRCADLLRACFFSGCKSVELASKLGYQSVHSLSVQKYKCVEKIREWVRKKTVKYEDFFE